ncbi:hypothetical protein LIER_12790 [Lithospermum erythrorhizon]|uniref:TPM domain-containing protein n=1 Tax=Lithospermum erythrorhizon TaxID=34254 RepID=A0AAV3PV73_LITER
METILSPPSFFAIFRTPHSPQPRSPSSASLSLTKPVCCCLKKQSTHATEHSFQTPKSWFSGLHQGLAALAISLALNFSPILATGSALGSEFDVLNEVPAKEVYVYDDAGVLSRVTKSDLKSLLSGLESRKGYHINFITVRKLTVR